MAQQAPASHSPISSSAEATLNQRQPPSHAAADTVMPSASQPAAEAQGAAQTAGGHRSKRSATQGSNPTEVAQAVAAAVALLASHAPDGPLATNTQESLNGVGQLPSGESAHGIRNESSGAMASPSPKRKKTSSTAFGGSSALATLPAVALANVPHQPVSAMAAALQQGTAMMEAAEAAAAWPHLYTAAQATGSGSHLQPASGLPSTVDAAQLAHLERLFEGAYIDGTACTTYESRVEAGGAHVDAISLPRLVLQGQRVPSGRLQVWLCLRRPHTNQVNVIVAHHASRRRINLPREPNSRRERCPAFFVLRYTPPRARGQRSASATTGDAVGSPDHGQAGDGGGDAASPHSGSPASTLGPEQQATKRSGSAGASLQREAASRSSTTATNFSSRQQTPSRHGQPTPLGSDVLEDDCDLDHAAAVLMHSDDFLLLARALAQKRSKEGTLISRLRPAEQEMPNVKAWHAAGHARCHLKLDINFGLPVGVTPERLQRALDAVSGKDGNFKPSAITFSNSALNSTSAALNTHVPQEHKMVAPASWQPWVLPGQQPQGTPLPPSALQAAAMSAATAAAANNDGIPLTNDLRASNGQTLPVAAERPMHMHMQSQGGNSSEYRNADGGAAAAAIQMAMGLMGSAAPPVSWGASAPGGVSGQFANSPAAAAGLTPETAAQFSLMLQNMATMSSYGMGTGASGSSVGLAQVSQAGANVGPSNGGGYTAAQSQAAPPGGASFMLSGAGGGGAPWGQSFGNPYQSMAPMFSWPGQPMQSLWPWQSAGVGASQPTQLAHGPHPGSVYPGQAALFGASAWHGAGSMTGSAQALALSGRNQAGDGGGGRDLPPGGGQAAFGVPGAGARLTAFAAALGMAHQAGGTPGEGQGQRGSPYLPPQQQDPAWR